ncbi:MAG: universal stress protein [Nitrospiria bacterium]
MEVNKVLLPTDFSELSNRAIQETFPVIKKLGAEVTFLHVLERLDHPDDMTALFDEGYAYLMDRSNALLDDWVAKAKAQGIPAKSVLKNGVPHVEVVTLAENEHFDLIIMGTHGRTGFNHLMMGSQTERVLRKAACFVMTIKAK